MDNTKKPWLSKTLWMNVILAVLAIAYQPAADFIGKNPEIVAAFWGGINVLLRWITKKEISIS